MTLLQILGWVLGFIGVAIFLLGGATFVAIAIGLGRGPRSCEDGTCDCFREDS